MLEIQRLRLVAVDHGFAKTGASEDGSTLWFSKRNALTGKDEIRMCLDVLTQSVSIFREKEQSHPECVTFRNADAMLAWLKSS
jgi:hypothetical protein